jgi:hypothetical protein
LSSTTIVSHTDAECACRTGELQNATGDRTEGLASITQTMDTYSHLMEDIGGDAVGSLDEAFGE